MSAGLDASTLTPGSTAPDASRTVPAIPLANACCAEMSGGENSVTATHRPEMTTLARTMKCLLPTSELPRLTTGCHDLAIEVLRPRLRSQTLAFLFIPSRVEGQEVVNAELDAATNPTTCNLLR